jgi:Protein of unknown function (DUF1488)
MRADERYTVRQDGIIFLMLDGPMEVVCEITLEALSQLGTTIGSTEPTDVFVTGRDAIERAASDKYDRTSRRPYEIITVTPTILSPAPRLGFDARRVKDATAHNYTLAEINASVANLWHADGCLTALIHARLLQDSTRQIRTSPTRRWRLR